jgi:hypothetical protein
LGTAASAATTITGAAAVSVAATAPAVVKRQWLPAHPQLASDLLIIFANM